MWLQWYRIVWIRTTHIACPLVKVPESGMVIRGLMKDIFLWNFIWAHTLDLTILILLLLWWAKLFFHNSLLPPSIGKTNQENMLSLLVYFMDLFPFSVALFPSYCQAVIGNFNYLSIYKDDILYILYFKGNECVFIRTVIKSHFILALSRSALRGRT